MKKALLQLIGLALVFVAGWLAGSRQSRDLRNHLADTTKAVAPLPCKTREAGTVTVPVTMRVKEADGPALPEHGIVVFPVVRDSLDSIYSRDSLYSHNSLDSRDSLVARVPMEQKEYTDSNYTVWVSGFMPRLDSIEVRSKVITIRETTTKRSRLNVGLTGGVGYGFFNRRPDVFIGVGVTWSLFKR